MREPELEHISPRTGYNAAFVASQGWNVRLWNAKEDRMRDVFLVWNHKIQHYIQRSEFYGFCRKRNKLLRWRDEPTKFSDKYDGF